MRREPHRASNAGGTCRLHEDVLGKQGSRAHSPAASGGTRGKSKGPGLGGKQGLSCVTQAAHGHDAREGLVDRMILS
jgi:hypothetical protein